MCRWKLPECDWSNRVYILPREHNHTDLQRHGHQWLQRWDFIIGYLKNYYKEIKWTLSHKSKLANQMCYLFFFKFLSQNSIPSCSLLSHHLPLWHIGVSITQWYCKWVSAVVRWSYSAWNTCISIRELLFFSILLATVLFHFFFLSGQHMVLWFPDRTSVCTHPWHHST